MKLLIVTQAVDTEDPVLGFFVRWIEEFAKHIERIEVICLKEGKHTLPANVHIHSLGKEKNASQAAYILNFYRYIWQFRHDYDTVFVHMNPEYVVLGGIFWRLWSKRIVLWYTHKSVNLKLRIAVLFAHDIFTASREGCPLTTDKLNVVGHGIDTALFHAPIKPFDTPLRIVSVGRITPIKNLDTLIEAVALLKERGIDTAVTLIGAPTKPSDEAYLESLKELAKNREVSGKVRFMGNIPHSLMPKTYREFDISVNLCPAGGMDKAVLESMAAGLLVFVSNTAFSELFGPYTHELMFKEKDAAACAEKIAAFMHQAEKASRARTDLQERVETMSVHTLIPRILSFL